MSNKSKILLNCVAMAVWAIGALLIQKYYCKKITSMYKATLEDD